MAYAIKCNFESAACSSPRSCRFSTPEPSKYGRPGNGGLSCRHHGSSTKKDGDSRDDRFSSYRSGGDDYCKRFAATCSDRSCDVLRLSSPKDSCKDRFKSACTMDDDLDDCGALSEESDDKFC